jgi:hypothetical protein
MARRVAIGPRRPASPNRGWGAEPCDGYNDVSATLHDVPIDGGAPITNGGDAPLSTNSWPRWSPSDGLAELRAAPAHVGSVAT